MNTLLDSLYLQLLEGIAAGRKIDVEAARALIDDPPMTPQHALERGLVTTIAYRDDVVPEEVIKGAKYLDGMRRTWSRGTKKIAIIYAAGAIVSGESQQDLFGGRTIGDRTLVKQLEDAKEDDAIAAVVLRVDSPGGSGQASDIIWHAIKQTREEKPVIVSMGDYAASGGYYIAAAADKIVAQPGTLTGSIGVFGGKLALGGLYDKLGMTTHTYKRGALSEIFSTTSGFDDAERAKFRTYLESFYNVFLERAAEGRGMTTEQIHAVAQGRVWTGQQALDHGLVDALGGLDTAVALARELGEASDAGIVRLPERKTFVDQLMEELAGGSDEEAVLGAFPAEIRDALLHARRLEGILDKGGVAALLPGVLTIE